MQDSPATRRQFAILFVVAVLTRLLVALTTMLAFDIPLERYTGKGDGESYKRYALVMRGKPTTFSRYDSRVFPGYPVLIAGADVVGIAPPVGSLLIEFLAVGIAAVAAAMLFVDLRIGYAMVFLIPHYLINSSLAMSEAPMLAFTLSGLLLGMRFNRPFIGGVLMGIAGLIRPMAAMATIGYLLWAFQRRDRKSALLFTSAAAAIVAAGMVGLRIWFGDALHNLHTYTNDPGAYSGSLFAWPFKSLLLTPFQDPTAPAKSPIIIPHVIVTLLACVMLLRRMNRPRELDSLSTPWLIGNTLFVLCLGSHWGFNHFHRFTIVAQPAMFYALQRWLPRRWWIWAVIGCVTVGSAIFGARRA